MSDAIKQAEAVLADVVEGPWFIVPYGDGDSLVIHHANEGRVCFMAVLGDDEFAWATIKANAGFIAWGREGVPALLALAKAQEAELARLKAPLGDEGKAVLAYLDDMLKGCALYAPEDCAPVQQVRAYIERQAAALVLKDEQLAEAVGGREFNGSRLRQYIERCNDLEAQLAALVLAGERVKALEAASHGIIDRMCETYMARNGRRVGIQGDDGEKCWIVHSDEIEELRRALTDGSEGGD